MLRYTYEICVETPTESDHTNYTVLHKLVERRSMEDAEAVLIALLKTDKSETYVIKLVPLE